MTDAEHIAVDFSTLQHLAGELEDILKQLNQRLALLYERTEKVVLTWDGEAREAFVSSLDRWSTDMADLQARQAWLHEVVTTAHTNYSSAHRAVLRGWGAA
ncbi:WXG100 family type VII secretion target [Streptomyces sp. NPDC079020]|uniref:WXG100 family type VII secretion target n=1 Tax=unclassified Streptomyces TaxID=2593676 RepID=UPI002E77865A|nr:WXG100 family type VII secretion target [Streptomyces sp. BE147]MEE1739363.1 WXG100 family type VII secretion target [Streptomyces sp. BE147]